MVSICEQKICQSHTKCSSSDFNFLGIVFVCEQVCQSHNFLTLGPYFWDCFRLWESICQSRKCFPRDYIFGEWFPSVRNSQIFVSHATLCTLVFSGTHNCTFWTRGFILFFVSVCVHVLVTRQKEFPIALFCLYLRQIFVISSVLETVGFLYNLKDVKLGLQLKINCFF